MAVPYDNTMNVRYEVPDRYISNGKYIIDNDDTIKNFNDAFAFFIWEKRVDGDSWLAILFQELGKKLKTDIDIGVKKYKNDLIEIIKSINRDDYDNKVKSFLTTYFNYNDDRFFDRLHTQIQKQLLNCIPTPTIGNNKIYKPSDEKILGIAGSRRRQKRKSKRKSTKRRTKRKLRRKNKMGFVRFEYQ